jgi:hypothetical protein
VHVAHMGEMRNAYKIVVGKPEGRYLLVRSTHKWWDNIKWILRKWCGRMWTFVQPVQDWDHWQAILNAVMKL